MLSERTQPKSGPVGPAAAAARYAFLVYGALLVVGLALDIWGITLVSDTAVPLDWEGLEQLGMIQLVYFLIVIVAIIVNVVLFLIWQYRAATAVDGRDDIVTPPISPGWHVGWWFIPIANLVMPALAIGQLYRASLAGARLSWSRQPFPGVVMGWWLLWLVSTAVVRYGAGRGQSAYTAAEYMQAYWASIAANVLELLALALILQIIRDISAAQAKWPESRAVAASPAESAEPA